MGAGDQVAADDGDVVDRHHRQVVAQAEPGAAVVGGPDDPGLGAGVEESGLLRVLPDHAADLPFRETPGEGAPGLAVILGLVQVGAEVVELEAGRRQVRGAGLVARGLDVGHHRPRLEVRRSDLPPLAAVVAADVNEPVVAARPQHPGLQGRLGEGVDGAVGLGAAGVLGQRPSRRQQGLRLAARQVRADRLPARALVPGAEEDVARGVQDVLLVPARRRSGRSS